MWICIKLHSLGYQVRPEHLPDCLDDQSKSFLIKKAGLMVEAEELRSLQNATRDIFFVKEKQRRDRKKKKTVGKSLPQI